MTDPPIIYLAYLSHHRPDVGTRVLAFHLELKSRFNFPSYYEKDTKIPFNKLRIQENIKNSAAFVIFISKNYYESSFCCLEFEIAIQLQKKITFLFDPDPNSDSTFITDLLVDFLFPLLNKVRSNSSELHLQLESAILNSHVLYGNRYASQRRENMFRSLFQMVNYRYEYFPVNRGVFLSEVFILAHPRYGEYLGTQVTNELLKLGIASAFLDYSEDIEEIFNNSESPYFQSLVIILQDGIFFQPHVLVSCKLLQNCKEKRVVFAHDSSQDLKKIKSQLNELEELHYFKALLERNGSILLENYLAFRKIAIKCGLQLISETILPWIDNYEVLDKLIVNYEVGTRNWLIDDLLKIQSKNAEGKKVNLLISEVNGMGKSTVFAELVRRYSYLYNTRIGSFVRDDSFNLAAFFFFDKAWNGILGSSTLCCVTCLALQLCSSIYGFRACLLKVIHRNEAVIFIKQPTQFSIKEILDVFLVKPLQLLKESMPEVKIKPFVILIDALDECDDFDRFLAILVDVQMELPSFVSFLISCIPPTTLVMLKCNKVIELKQNDERNIEDIQVYCRSRFDFDIGESEDVLKLLVEQCRGEFLWFNFHEQRLKQPKDLPILYQFIQTLPKGLDSTYEKLFEILYDKLRFFAQSDDVAIETYQLAVIAGLILPREPMPDTIWSSVIGFLPESEEYLQFKKDIEDLKIFSEHNYVKIPHKSMYDWLTRSSKEKNHLRVKVQIKHHFLLALRLEMINSTVDYDNLWVRGRFLNNPEQLYAASHCFHHWIQSGSVDEANNWLLDVSHFISLLECCTSNRTRNERLFFFTEMLLNDIDNMLSIFEESNPKRIHIEHLQQLLLVSKVSLLREPREIIGQILGRISPSDEDYRIFIEQAKKGILQTQEKHVHFALPLKYEFSGLIPVGTSILKQLFHDTKVNTVAIAADTKWIVTGCEDGIISVFDDKRLLRTFELPEPMISHVSVSNDGELISACTSWGKAFLLQMSNGSFKRLEKNCIRGVLSKDGKYLVTSYYDNKVLLWSCDTVSILKSFEQHSEIIHDFVLAEDLLLTGSKDKSAILWDTKTGSSIQVFIGTTDEITAVAMASLDLILTGSKDGKIIQWNYENGDIIRKFEQVECVNMLLVSRNLQWIVGVFGTKRVIVFDQQAGSVCKELDDSIKTIAMDPECEYLLTISSSENPSQNQLVNMYDFKKERKWDQKQGDEHSNTVSCLAVSHDMKFVVTGGVDCKVILWNLTTGDCNQVLENQHTDRIQCITISNDSGFLVSGSSDKTAILWEVSSTLQLKLKFRQTAHSELVRDAAISKDNTLVATCSDDKSCLLWSMLEIKNYIVLRKLLGHTQAINSLAISSNSAWILTGSRDATAILWDINEDQKIIRKFANEHLRSVTTVAISVNMMYCITGSTDSSAILWDIITGNVLMRFSHQIDSMKLQIDVVSIKETTENVILVETCNSYYGTILWNGLTGEKIKLFQNQFLLNNQDFLDASYYSVELEQFNFSFNNQMKPVIGFGLDYQHSHNHHHGKPTYFQTLYHKQGHILGCINEKFVCWRISD